MSLNIMTIDEINEVSGGTEWQCVAGFGIAGGALGAGVGAWTTAGFGAWAGFEGGALIGTLAGGAVCGFFY